MRRRDGAAVGSRAWILDGLSCVEIGGAAIFVSMVEASGFSYTQRKSGEVVISHHGRVATTLRGQKAARFLARVDEVNAQGLMARLTGNYKRGNER